MTNETKKPAAAAPTPQMTDLGAIKKIQTILAKLPTERARIRVMDFVTSAHREAAMAELEGAVDEHFEAHRAAIAGH